MKRGKAKPRPVGAAPVLAQAGSHVRGVRASRAKALSESNADQLLHELRVHQAELEIQNEELIRARGETETALALYTELFDFAPIGYATLSENEKIVEVNHTGARILGKARSKVVGATFTSFISVAARKPFVELLDRSRAEDKPGMDVPLTIAEGRSIVARVTARALGLGPRKVLLAFEDVTEHRDREGRLALAEASLREADKRKDEFLAVLSHELRNPLAPIRTSLFVLAHASPGSDETFRAREVIERQVSQMTRLVDDLLDVTRILRKTVQLRREVVEGGDLFRRAVEDHVSSFAASGIHLEWKAGAGQYWIDGDAVRLVQVLSNLLGNSRKFTPPSGRVTVTLGRDGRRCVVTVQDSGVGIRPDELPMLFEPFSQSPQPLARSKGGLGLGLTMVKGFIELHGGHVEIVSDGPGRGTAVTLSLPMTEPPPEWPRAAPVSSSPSGPGRRVLVIDDNIDGADTLQEALGRDRHDVRVAYDGQAGLEIARSFRPEVVICDIGLPRMDGYEVAQAFRADPNLRGTYLVALSGYARLEDRRKAAAAGFNEHVAKPPDVMALERILDEAPSAPPVDLAPA